MLNQIRIVLVRPAGPINVGAACRAMTNMGLSQLVIVAPGCDLRDEQVVNFAMRGRPVLDAARVVPDIPAALDGCIKTFATSAKLGLYRRQAAIPPAEAADLAVQDAAGGTVAIAFGPEDRGLKVGELLHFDRVISIPAAPEYPVLNLAAAVAVVCYELHQAWLRVEQRGALPTALEHDRATDAKKRVMFAKLFDALDRLGFFSEQSPDKLKFALRHMFGRLEMNVHEVDILIGMAQQIRWYIDHHPERTQRGER